ILKGDPLAGLGSYQAGMGFEVWRPLRLTGRLRGLRTLIGVTVNEKSAFSGPTVGESKGFLYSNNRDELVALPRGPRIRAERHKSAEKKKEYNLPKPYSKEQLAEIDAAYEAERRQGAEPRYWEDVKVGEELPPIVRGPLRTSDLIVWHVGWGMQ